jgi:hypothetical protein
MPFILAIILISALAGIVIKSALNRQRKQDAAMNAAPGDSWPCPICREQIPKGAKKCIKCQSELRWRRYLIFGSSTLALITALVSVIAVSAPAIKRIFETEDSDVHGVYVGALFGSPSGGPKNGRLNILIDNRGNKMGAVTGGTLSLSNRKTDKMVELQLTTPDGLPVFIAARDTKPVTMDIGFEFLPDWEIANEDEKKGWVAELKSLLSLHYAHSMFHEEGNLYCLVDLDVTNASGEYKSPSLFASCQELAQSLLVAVERSKLKAK